LRGIPPCANWRENVDAKIAGIFDGSGTGDVADVTGFVEVVLAAYAD
jgi:hypothetical protein